MIATILVRPHADTRSQLLAPSAPSCRLIAPGSVQSWGTVIAEPRRTRHCSEHGGSCPVDEFVHLPLARNGAEVPEGEARCGTVLGQGRAGWIRSMEIAMEVAVLLGHEPGMDPGVALERLRQIVAPLGALVLLDADGAEVTS